MSIQLKNWMTIRVSGKDALTYLNGIVSIDFHDLGREWKRALLLTPKGKIRSVFWIKNDGESFYLITSPVYRTNLIEDLLKYNLNISVKLENLTEELPPAVFTIGEQSITGLGKLRGEFDWQDTADSSEDFNELVIQNDGCPPDLLLGRHPLEMGMMDSIALEKGCFLGQETVSRMFHRGKPRTMLVGVDRVIEQLFTEDGKSVEIIARGTNRTICSVPFGYSGHLIDHNGNKYDHTTIGEYPPQHKI